MGRLAINGGARAITRTWPRWPIADERELELLREVLDGGTWGGTQFGPKVAELNERFARYCDGKYGVALDNGTVTMELTLQALGVGPGDEVIVPAYTFIATAIVVTHVGATPVFVDVDPKTVCIDPEAVERAVSGRTKAVIPVHFAGHPCDMDRLMAVSKKHGVEILEDCAQCHGAIWKGRKLGAVGRAGSYSFQQTKNMPCGEGGMVVTDDRDLADTINYSMGKFGRGVRDEYETYTYYRLGRNACMSEFQAAVALAQLERLEEQTVQRAVNGQVLIDLLDEIEGIEPLRPESYCDRHGWHLFLFRYKRDVFEGVPKERFAEVLTAEGIETSVIYPVSLFRQPMYDLERMTLRGTDHPIRVTSCPESDRACEEILSFGHNVLLTDREGMEQIVGAVRKVQERIGELVEEAAVA